MTKFNNSNKVRKLILFPNIATMMSFDLNIFLGILYIVLVYVAITVIYALTVTDYLMKIWKSKQISGMRRVLLITAHPDDECMFFGPTLVALAKAIDVRIYVLCLSSGKLVVLFYMIFFILTN